MSAPGARTSVVTHAFLVRVARVHVPRRRSSGTLAARGEKSRSSAGCLHLLDAACGERCHHLLHCRLEHRLIDSLRIDLSPCGPVPHLLGRRPIERIDYDLSRGDRLGLVFVATARRGWLWLVFPGGSGRNANHEIGIRPSLCIALPQKLGSDEFVHATSHLKRASGHVVWRGRFRRKTEPKSTKRCETSHRRAGRLYLRWPGRGRGLASRHGSYKDNSYRSHHSPVRLEVECLQSSLRYNALNVPV
jgi:hypothetical protein